MEPLLKPEEATDYLNVTEDELNHFVNSGKIPCVRLSKRIKRFRKQDIENINLHEKEIEKPHKKQEEAKPTIGAIYFIGTHDEVYKRTESIDDEWYSVVKIGFTTSLKNRLRKLRTASLHRIYLLGLIEDKTMKIEQNLHALFSERRLEGEWFYYKNTWNDGLFRKIDKHRINHRGTYKRLMNKY